MAAPSWSDAVQVQAVAKVAAGSTARATFNLGDYFVGRLFLRAMRLSSSTPSNGIYIIVRDLLTGTPAGGSGTVPITHPNSTRLFQDNTTASNLTTLSATPGSFPAASISLTSATGFAGNEICGITNSTSTPTVIEFGRTSKISGTTLTFDVSLQNTALASGDTITNNAFVIPPLIIDGTPASGDIEIVFDNGSETTVAYAVEAWGQVLTSIA